MKIITSIIQGILNVFLWIWSLYSLIALGYFFIGFIVAAAQNSDPGWASFSQTAGNALAGWIILSFLLMGPYLFYVGWNGPIQSNYERSYEKRHHKYPWS